MLGMLALFAYALGGEIARRGLLVIFCIGMVAAAIGIPSVRRQPVGAWYAAPWGRRSLLVVKGIRQLCDQDELEAILAHELCHSAPEDKLLRLVAGVAGGCLPSLFAGWMMAGGKTATISQLVLILLVSCAAAGVHWGLLRLSESRVDAAAAKILKDPAALPHAHAKLVRANREIWGLATEETGKSEAELQAENLAPLGGLQAVPKIWAGDAGPLTAQDTQDVIQHLQSRSQLSLIGEQILALVDGRRTVAEICQEAQSKHGHPEFHTCRILAQLKAGKVIES